MPTKRQIAVHLARACDDLVEFPRGNSNSVLHVPYQGVLQGITIEGSPEGYAWRIVVFSFVPLMGASTLLLSRVPEFEIWWDGRDGSLLNGEANLERLVGRCLDIQSCSIQLHKRAYRPWMAERATPSLLLKASDVPKPAITQSGLEVWTPAKVSDAIRYALVGMAAGERQRTVELLRAIESCAPDVDFDGVRSASVVQLETVQEILCALKLTDSAQRAWVAERENRTLASLHLTREFVESLR
jgi:hypothetical protein